MALSKALKTDMPSVAKMLQSMGRGKDTILAHITPEEARLLKARGGRGSINPDTGLPEFETGVEGVTVSALAPTITPDIGTIDTTLPSFTTGDTGVTDKGVEQVIVSAPRVAPSFDVGTIDTRLPEIFGQQPVVAQTLQAPAAGTAATAPQGLPTEQALVTAPRISPDLGAIAVTPPSFPEPEPSVNEQVKSFLGNNSTLLSLLGLGGMGLLGGANVARGAGQGAQLQKQLAALGQPLQQLGNATLSTTMAGGLTPQNAQALQAAQAQIASQQARGAVSAAQAAEAISQTYAGLLQNQLQTSINLLNTADSYLQQAYIQGYNANVANQTATQNFYSTLGQLVMRMGGLGGGGGGTTITLPAGSTVSGG